MTEQTALRRAFAKGLVACLGVVVALGFVIHALNAGNHRPEGIAERWLTAVGDTGRKGVRADATARADKIGPLSIARPLRPADVDDRHGLFSDLEVGRATHTAGGARVPFRLHEHVRHGKGPPVEAGRRPRPERTGSIVMRRVGGSWEVVALDRRLAGERVPSEGGAPPSRAPASLWLAGLAIGVGLAAIAALLVRWAAAPATGTRLSAELSVSAGR